MTRKIYNKLVRDKIPEIILSNHGQPKISILNDQDYLMALKQKLIEEAREVEIASSREEVLSEIADVQQLVSRF